MAYTVPKVWSHGDVPTAALMNAYSTSLTEIYNKLAGKRHCRGVKCRQWLSRTADTLFDGMVDTNNSYQAETHLLRWLFYGGEGAIVSLDGTESTPLSNDGTVNIYDLDSVDWLNYGQAYHITGVDWAMEDWEP